MKSVAKFTLMILALALACWAQTATQSTTNANDAQKAPAAQSETKAECPCCQKMADSKDAMSCCAHHSHASGGKEEMSCCGGKDGKSCMKGDKSAKASCADGKGCTGEAQCCSGKDGKSCCAGADKGDKMAMTCCGHGHCGMGHDHTDMDKMDK